MEPTVPLQQLLARLRERHPLVLGIANYVTANDCANALLALGAAPVLGDDPGDVAELADRCDALFLNLGTPTRPSLVAMDAAARRANKLGRPVVLDPVGAGATRFRTDAARHLLAERRIAVVSGNASEIKALADGAGETRGVDAAATDAVTDATLADWAARARRFAAQVNAVVAISGAIDIVADARRAVALRNGTPRMATVTGSGCMRNALMAAFLGIAPEDPFLSAQAAACLFGIAGELAEEAMQPADGNATYRNRLIDAVERLSAADIARRARLEDLP